MKILFVIHGFLPFSSTGVENYTYTLAKSLKERDDVIVYTARFDPLKKKYENFTYNYEGIEVRGYYHNSLYHNFEETYSDSTLDEKFSKVVDEFNPDVVHFQHLLFHSIGYVDVLKRHNIRSVLTLHDFYYYCPNLGQKLFLGRYICRGKFPLKCMLCFRTSKINISKIDASIYSKFGHNSFLTEITKRIPSITYIVKGVRLLQRHPSFEEIIKRDIDLLGFLGKVDVIISPSMYYRRFYEDLTGRRDIVYLDYGFDTKVTNTFNEKRPETERLILGFAGTISRHKGAHLIVKLAEKLGDRILIYIWGNDKNDLILSKRLRSLKNVIYKGELKGGDKSEIYGSIDYLIVPSIWEENSPLVIHEALLYNVPVIASNRGGNAELVLEGKNGFLFDPDKEDSLLRLIERIINEKIRISKVDRSVVMDIYSHTGILRDRYYLKQDIEKSPS